MHPENKAGLFLKKIWHYKGRRSHAALTTSDAKPVYRTVCWGKASEISVADVQRVIQSPSHVLLLQYFHECRRGCSLSETV